MLLLGEYLQCIKLRHQFVAIPQINYPKISSEILNNRKKNADFNLMTDVYFTPLKLSRVVSIRNSQT